MKKGTVVVLIAVVAGGFYALGGLAKKGGSHDPSAVAEKGDSKGPAAPADGIERYRVPVEGAMRGSPNAKVTIVAFSDFQCPFCSRVIPTLDKIMKEYPGQVRMYFRHNPLPFHPDAPLAAEAALAAQDQGKFWEMHDKLFTNQQNIKRPDLEKYAGELGLDMGKFKSALDSSAHKSRIDADLALARQIGVQGTPNFFLNGRPIQGAVPYDDFKKVIDDEIARADKLLAKGVAPGQLY